jgi:hypothetical protein
MKKLILILCLFSLPLFAQVKFYTAKTFVEGNTVVSFVSPTGQEEKTVYFIKRLPHDFITREDNLTEYIVVLSNADEFEALQPIQIDCTEISKAEFELAVGDNELYKWLKLKYKL